MPTTKNEEPSTKTLAGMEQESRNGFPEEASPVVQALEEMSGLAIFPECSVLLIGSHAEGMATPESDRDHMIIYGPIGEAAVPYSNLPAQLDGGTAQGKGQALERADRSQRAYRIDEFAQLLCRGNADVVQMASLDPIWEGAGRTPPFTRQLARELRPLLVTQRYVASCASHFARVDAELAKRKHVRLPGHQNPHEEGKIGKRAELDDKYLMHALRMGRHALHAERTGERLSLPEDPWFPFLMDLKGHRVEFLETLERFDQMRAELLSPLRAPREGQHPWVYDAARAAHLRRDEQLHTKVRDLFREALAAGGQG